VAYFNSTEETEENEISSRFVFSQVRFELGIPELMLEAVQPEPNCPVSLT
jgi:hypothetical protein